MIYDNCPASRIDNIDGDKEIEKTIDIAIRLRYIAPQIGVS
jgi:hypothetical protein